MSYPSPTPDQVRAFRERGWLAVEAAVPEEEVRGLGELCEELRSGDKGIDWRRGSEREVDQVLQSMLELVDVGWRARPFHRWTLRFAQALLGGEAALWYNQLLDKPPLRGAPTHWHQDGASFGAETADRLVSCWMALDAVDLDSGCMHFVDRGHRDGVLPHKQVGPDRCGIWDCDVDEDRVIAVPLPRGGVTFHHGLTPHMTRPNRSPRWRQVIIQRFFLGPPPQGR